MQIQIRNCNSIDNAELTIVEKKLNIKFAPNGTGKSTIAKAILYSAIDTDRISELLPFKLRKENPSSLKPEINNTSEINSVMCFNEEYVNQFTFQKDELISNSFDIFIKNEAYRKTESEIEEIVNKIKVLFLDNVDLEIFIKNLTELSDAFKTTKSGLSKSSTGMKALSSGNKIQHIPQGLEAYKPFISSTNNVNWIDWQTKGLKDFYNLSECCPFCTEQILDKKDTIELVGKEYDKNVIKNLVSIINVIEKLGEYFSEEAKEKLKIITTLPNSLEEEHEEFLKNIKKQIDLLVNKLQKLKQLNGFDFKTGDKVSETLDGYKLNLQFFPDIDSEKTRVSLASINNSIDEVSKQAGQLQGKIAIQRNGMQKLIEKHQSDINNFLAYAGYKYSVQLNGDDEKAQLRLMHVDHDEFLSGGDQHLSFGERNAFAIVLFMYECLAKKPDLIILDDPISSFDKNKKYAILEMLFRREAKDCLKGQTVLMLTHDVEPIIDTVKSVSSQFSNQVNASYLKYIDGEINEQNITKSDIKTFTQICKGILASEKSIILKLIYLRRYYEITDNIGDEYQILSNLLHLREQPIDTRESLNTDESTPIMDEQKYASGCLKITNLIPQFDYSTLLSSISDISTLTTLYKSCSNNYEKLQVFRLFEPFGLNTSNSVIRKFINETYHIENEYICQLDPSQFDLIPDYVRHECDKCLTSVIQ